MPQRTRTRSLPSTLTSKSKVTVGNEEPLVTSQEWTFPGYQITVSEGHPWSSRKKGNNRDDIGGPFYTKKVYADLPVQEYKTTTEPYPTVFYELDSFFSPNIPPDTWWLSPPSLESSLDDLAEYGTTAIAQCEPTKAIAETSTAIGELWKDGIPDLPVINSLKERTAPLLSKVRVKGAAEAHLNTVFGWLPLLSDSKKLLKGVQKLEEHLQFLESNSGKVVRRSFHFDSVTSHRKDTVANQQVMLAFGQSGGPADSGLRGEITVEVNTLIDRWFSGGFIFYMDSGFDSRKLIGEHAAKARHALQVLGADPSPDTLWNLAPWSWAVDWFTNAGDVIHNVSKFTSGQLVLQYGYMMEHTVHTYTVRHNGPSGLVGVGSVPPFKFTTETKRRIPASPYGFGANWEGLSAFQLSVLAALGITKKS